MSIRAEIAFDSFFRSSELSLSDRQYYKGRQDLDLLQPEVRSFLGSIQAILNEELRNEKEGVTGHVDYPSLHFDFVDSSVPNAVAFRFQDFSFIGVTLGLVNMLWDSCVRLSESDAIAGALNIRLTPQVRDSIHGLLFGTQLAFAVVHEYTHHVHGHLVGKYLDQAFSDEIIDDSGGGDLESQAREVDADCYATYYVLNHLVKGSRRQHALCLLSLENGAGNAQDEVLFSSFLIAVGAFLFCRPPSGVDRAKIHKLTHPPQAARMNFIMHSAISWCKQNKPELENYMTRDRFQKLMHAVAVATWGMNGGDDWSIQTQFLLSNEGAAYIANLDALVKAHIKSLYQDSERTRL